MYVLNRPYGVCVMGRLCRACVCGALTMQREEYACRQSWALHEEFKMVARCRKGAHCMSGSARPSRHKGLLLLLLLLLQLVGVPVRLKMCVCVPSRRSPCARGWPGGHAHTLSAHTAAAKPSQREHVPVWLCAKLCMCGSAQDCACAAKRDTVHVWLSARLCMCSSAWDCACVLHSARLCCVAQREDACVADGSAPQEGPLRCTSSMRSSSCALAARAPLKHLGRKVHAGSGTQGHMAAVCISGYGFLETYAPCGGVRCGFLWNAGPCGWACGCVRAHAGLLSSDPFCKPAINPNYYSDPEGADIRTLREGIRLGRKIMQQEPMAKYIVEVRDGAARRGVSVGQC